MRDMGVAGADGRQPQRPGQTAARSSHKPTAQVPR